MNTFLVSVSGLFVMLGCQGVGQSSEGVVATPNEADAVEVPQEKVGSVEIIGHRGASYDAPENTLASIKLAWKQHADAAEIDIWLTSDNQIVVMHDKTPKRYGGPDTLISDMTLEQMRALDVGAWKDPRWRGEKVPLLSEVLKLIPEGKRLFIEIKCGPEVLPSLRVALQESKIPSERIALIGFSDSTMKLAHERFPELKTYWIVGLKKDKLTGAPSVSAASLLKTFSEIGVSGLDLGGETSLLTKSYMAEIQQRKIPWYVWTVDSAEEAKRLHALGVRGVTTNRPGFLREGLLQQPQQ
jgi:glycerophosphoryl diester phosphodiesterase